MIKKYVGELHFVLSNEIIKYTDETSFISAYKEQVYNCGINSVLAVVHNPNNLDLRYEIESVKYGEYCESLPKKQYLISTLSPDFKLNEKLKTIYEYENSTEKKHRITSPYSNIVIQLTDGILENMSVKAIKNLVDRHYEKVIDTLQNNKAIHKKKQKDIER